MIKLLVCAVIALVALIAVVLAVLIYCGYKVEMKKNYSDKEKDKQNEETKKTGNYENIKIPEGKKWPIFTGNDRWDVFVHPASDGSVLMTYHINLLNLIYGSSNNNHSRKYKNKYIVLMPAGDGTASLKIVNKPDKKREVICGDIRFSQDYGVIFKARRHKKNHIPIYVEYRGRTEELKEEYRVLMDGMSISFGEGGCEGKISFAKVPFLLDKKGSETESEYKIRPYEEEITLKMLAVSCYKYYLQIKEKLLNLFVSKNESDSGDDNGAETLQENNEEVKKL